MALDKDALSELLDALRAGGDLDLVCSGLQLVLQALIELEAAQRSAPSRTSAAPSGRPTATGPASALLSTKAGDMELRIPKLRSGSFYPSLLEPRRRIDRALWAVVMEAYVHGVSTRKVDDLVRALGIDAGICKSEVSPHLRRARRARGRLPRAPALATPGSPTCSWTPPTSRPTRARTSCPRRW